jgi:DegV family protein with EDD domain
MSKIAIVTDSTATIPEKIIDKLNINVVPYYIHRGKEVLRDLISVQRDSFYRWLPTAKELPKTASPGPGDYVSIYQQLALKQKIEQIISIHMTSKGSGAYQAAMAAKEMVIEKLPKLRVEVVDTLNVSMCHGWMVIEAARMAEEGNTMDNIINRVKELIPITRMIQTADTLKYLYLGGRIGKAKHLIGSLLNIKPIISMEDGEIVALGVARSRKQTYRLIAEKVEDLVGTGGKIKIAYVHAAAMEEAEKIRVLIQQRMDVVEELFAELPPALGVHSGPGTVGVCFYPLVPN